MPREPLVITIGNVLHEVALEEKCTKCNGIGLISVGIGKPSPPIGCNECYGSGCTPTKNGKKILQFIRERLLDIMPNYKD